MIGRAAFLISLIVVPIIMVGSGSKFYGHVSAIDYYFQHNLVRFEQECNNTPLLIQERKGHLKFKPTNMKKESCQEKSCSGFC